MNTRKISSTAYPIPILMLDAADRVTGKTGLTLTVTISKNGGAFGAAAGAVTEIGNGWYCLAGNAGDRDTLGALLINATATGAIQAGMTAYEITTLDAFAALPQVDLVNAPNATAITAIQAGLALAAKALSTDNSTNDRAAKLDNLDAAITTRLAPAGTLARVTLTDTATTLTESPVVPSVEDIQAGLAKTSELPAAPDNASIAKIRAAVYDSAAFDQTLGKITLSNGAVQTFTDTGVATVEP